MATLVNSLTNSSAVGAMRPFEPSRDMSAVADLVEICFGDTLDPDGQNYLHQMRIASDNSGFFGWNDLRTRPMNLPTFGYVWVEDGRLVGNLSLIPFIHRNRKYYLIANVAVHPDFRRRGIGLQLTQRGIEHAQQKGALAAWLQVREENMPAVSLYQSLGFVERTRRTTWFSQKDYIPPPLPNGLEVATPSLTDWEQQRGWLELTYPPDLSWHFAINIHDLRPGWMGGFRRFFRQINLRQWGIYQAGKPRGFLVRLGSPNFADNLWLAAPAEGQDIIPALLRLARQRSSRRRALALDYPAGQAVQAIQSAGFYAHQTLMWMELDFTNHP